MNHYNTYLFTYHFSTATDEPNNAEGKEDCMEIYGRGSDDKYGYRWNDLYCDQKNNGYICMKGGMNFSYKISQL